VCAGNTATLFAAGGTTYTWYDAPNGNVIGTGQAFTTPILNKTTTYYVVVTENGCPSAITPVTANVSPPPQAPASSNVSICTGSPANLHASAPGGGVFNWYTTPTGGTSLISSPDYTTPPLAASTTYYVETALNGCVSPRTAVTVIVNPMPVTPAAQSYTTCFGSSVTLTEPPLPTGNYQWYDAVAGGNLLATAPNYTTPALQNSVTYYVQANNGGCASPRTAISVVVLPPPPAPSVSGGIVCSGTSATLTATGPGGTYSWYNAAAGGTLLGTGATYNTPPLKANTTYYVQTSVSGCISPRAAVTVSVLAATAAPTASNTSVCSGNSATISATTPNNNYAWYDSAVGGNLLSNAQVYVTPALTTTTTYYVETTANGCTSARTPVKVTVNPLPAAPVVNSGAVCSGTSVTLTAAGGGVIQWYDAPAGGTLLKTGTTYKTPVLTVNTTYYVQSSNGTCISPRAPVTVTINTKYNPEFQYPSGTFCATGPNPTPVINNPAGGTFSAAPAGLVFVSTTTGEINITASTPGKYTVSFTNNGVCPGITTAGIAILATTNASFSYGGPYCQGGVNPLPTFPGGASAGSFSATPAGLVFANTSTGNSGEIDLSASKPNTYTVTNTINATGGCPASVATSTVTIDPEVIVSAGPGQTVKAGTPVQLAGSITGGTTVGKWSGGTGSFSNPNILNPIYTPGPGETSATLTLTSIDPPGPCGIKIDKVTIIFSTQPSTPSAAGLIICAGSNATLSATAPGGVYQWYDAAAGGNLLSTGPTFSTPPLAANTTYYVQTTKGGVTSGRTPVTVTVNTPPAQPVVAATQICMGSPATLTATGSAGAYQWYDAAAGGNLLSVKNTYVTPALTTATSYYVQATLNGCTSLRTQVDVTVTPVPNITSAATGATCSGSAINYTITSNIPTATFSWSRASVAGISNAAAVNQASAIISETLINTTANSINVTYIITPAAGLCTGPSFNYVVTVYPAPVVTSAAKVAICDATTDNYAITFSTPVSGFTWARATVPGISNAAVSGQTAGVIKEVLFNTSNAPIDVTYVFTFSTSTCPGVPFNLVMTVNPTTAITSAASGIACSGQPQDYVIQSNVAGTTFNWNRPAVNNITNPGVFGQTSGTINETLINTSPVVVNVRYNITPIANGCPGNSFVYFAKVNPPMVVPVANSNSPVCSGTSINLRTDPVVGATYSWTGPNGFTSALQNPDIVNVTAAAAGTYSLVVTVNGCSTLPVVTPVAVDEPPLANAGPDQVVCIASPFVFLNGTVTGGTSTGIWTTSGTGTFSPSSNALNAQYITTAADKAAGTIILTLTSTSKDNCTISTSTMKVRFGPLPAVSAGPDQDVCSQATTVALKGTSSIGGTTKWTTTGTGTFSPSDGQLDATYNPSAADAKNGSVTLILNLIGAGVCFIPADSMTVKFIPPPTVNAGGIRYVLKNRTITLNPTVSDDNVHYLWSPNIDINNDTLKNPTITGDVDRVYTLTVTDSRGCVSQDTTLIKVSPPINIDNTFTPNGDGVNDYWDITGLIAYVNASVDIFDRYGQKVFHSLGYPKPWDGTINGKQLPVGVYYYVINTNFNGQVLAGYVTIIR